MKQQHKQNSTSLFPHFHKNRNVILPPHCAATVHLPKDDEIIMCEYACVRVRLHVCVAIQSRSLDTRARASLLQFTSITSYNPISHSIDPQNCCSPEPAANTGISPHHFTTIVLYYTKKLSVPPTPPSTPKPLS